MKKVTIHCDCCEKEIQEVALALKINEIDYQDPDEGGVLVDQVVCSRKCLEEAVKKAKLIPNI